MKRRSIINACAAFGAGTAIFAVTDAARAQPTGKVWRVGFLSLLSGPSEGSEAFREQLRSLGYVEGRNLSIDFRWASGSMERAQDMTTELVQQKVDLIVAVGPAAPTAKRASSAIPIVMVAHGDPVGAGLIASLANPGNNVTGTSNMASELAGKRIQLLRELLPKTSRIAVLVMKSATATPLFLDGLRASAQPSGVTLLIHQEDQPEALAGAFAAMQKEQAQALIVQLAPFTFEHRKRIVELAAQHRLPALFESSQFVDLGGLLSYGPSLTEIHRRSATYVDKILKGAKPADLPVELPTRFEMVLNLKTAKALGLTVPYSLMLQATKVIE